MSRQLIKTMFAGCVGYESHYYDFGEGYPEKWDYVEADRCQECGKIVVPVHGEEQHRYVDSDTNCNGYVCCEGPMMNYWWPLPNNFERDHSNVQEAAVKLIDVSLCIVHEEHTGTYGLALTGGGMDLSWAICAAYMELGYLPPVAACHLPRFAGMKLTTRNKWVLAGCNRSALIAKRWAKNERRHLREVRAWMKEQ